MTTPSLPAKTRRVGPYFRASRNALDDQFDGRSREGRFVRKVEAEIVAQLGGTASFIQMSLIRRAARTMLQLELLDKKFSSGTWTQLDGHVQGGLANNLRLVFRELGVKAPQPRKSTWRRTCRRPSGEPPSLTRAALAQCADSSAVA
jgi:hypothetical protein